MMAAGGDRARFTLAWETALRPETLNRLQAPEDYRPGASTLVIRDEADKARFGRELPLSLAARAALDSVCPDVGPIFGEHDYRGPLRKAALAAGIDKFRAERVTDYDFRHSRLTYLGEVSDNLSGIMFIAGHKDPGTTARYMKPQKRAAKKGAPGCDCRGGQAGISVALWSRRGGFRSHQAGRSGKKQRKIRRARRGTRTPMAINR
jgi:integrase